VGTLRVCDVHESNLEDGARERRLLIDCRAELGERVYVLLKLLIDTGAEVNVIRKGLIPEKLLIDLDEPWRLTTANQQRLEGGDKEVRVVLHFGAHDVDTGRRQILKIPTTFIVAELGAIDAIVSYAWLGKNNFLVNGKRHGICQVSVSDGGMIWVPGMRNCEKKSGVKSQGGTHGEHSMGGPDDDCEGDSEGVGLDGTDPPLESHEDGVYLVVGPRDAPPGGFLVVAHDTHPPVSSLPRAPSKPAQTTTSSSTEPTTSGPHSRIKAPPSVRA